MHGVSVPETRMSIHPQHLTSYHCLKCKKLLCRGLMGIGVFEMKCTRCAKVRVIHHIHEDMIGPNSFALMCDARGYVISASLSAIEYLGYEMRQLLTLHIGECNMRLLERMHPVSPYTPHYGALLSSMSMYYVKSDGTTLTAPTQCTRFNAGKSYVTLLVANVERVSYVRTTSVKTKREVCVHVRR